MTQPKPKSTMTFRRYLILAMVTLTASVGDTFLSVGAKQIGPISLVHPGHFFNFSREGFLVLSLITPEQEFQEGAKRLLKYFDR